MQFVHHAIVVGKILKAASCVDCAGDAETIEFAEEEPRRIELIFTGELWSLGEGGIENVGVRLRDEKAGGIAVAVPLNLASRKIRGVLVVADGTQRRCIQKGSILQVHHEHGRVWGGCVDLIECWHPAFGKLKFGPTSNHPYPLRRWSSRSLIFQHAQCIGQRRDAIPAQFQVVVEPATDRMHVGIVEPRDDGSPAPVNHSRVWAAKPENLVIVADSSYLSGRYGDRFDK